MTNPYSWTTETARAITHAEQVLQHLRAAYGFQYCGSWQNEMRAARASLNQLEAEFKAMDGAY